MKVLVNHDRAYEVIISAIDEAKKLTDCITPHSALIRSVILGSHLTYRYILVTGLLAKATNKNVNPLVLQAKAEVDGAYDARSLCHSVIVGKVETQFLEGKLGASNEPFLNKPARYTVHSSDNPVRGGNDKEIQLKSIEILQEAQTSSQAYEMLVAAMFYTLQRPNRAITPTANNFNFQETIHSMVENACDGESCAIVSALALYLLAEKNEWQIKAHPVNQAGSSSNEVLDIDVYCNENIFLSIEVKDKVFSSHDVHHAITKAAANGVSKVIFLKGPRAIALNTTEYDAIISAARHGVSLTFSYVTTFAMTCYSLGTETNNTMIIEFVNQILKDVRAKDSTVEYLTRLFSE
ncbi:restriction endonuclease, SacI family [Pseudescherichia sp.]|uniref:restriction endonuclease, SacI family n=1 Tax=Pseudescherichia sp. TaxID=2055881 RepID=UPI0028A1A50E|nr:restriction endonuclease, SacI family [Pseudescherichia sp.]